MNRQHARRRYAVSRTPSRVTSWLGSSLLAVTMAQGLGLELGFARGRPARAQEHDAGKTLAPGLRASEVLDLVKSLVRAGATFDAYPRLMKLGFENSELQAKDLIAFEENRSFVYAMGACAPGSSAGLLGESGESREPA